MKYEEHELIAKLGEKISKMCKSIGEVEQDGKNKDQNYGFISSDNLLSHMRSNLSLNQLAIFPNLDSVESENRVTDKKGGGKNYWTKTTVGMSFEVVDTETGYVKTFTWTGSDQDTGGKSMGQAITECTKRFYFKLFQVSSKEDKDPDSKTDDDQPPNEESPPIDDNQAMQNALKPPEKKQEPAKSENKKLGKWAKKLLKLAKSPLHQTAIQTILREKIATPESIRSEDEEAASVVCLLIENQRDKETAPSVDWSEKLSQMCKDDVYLKIINDLIVSGDIKGEDLKTMHAGTAQKLCETLEKTKGFADAEETEQSETQPESEFDKHF